ncbi:hypothetical protein ncot_04315 [Nocardioides sp. JQ2195]|uniref:hypothetical protein n=1 Tax=Nocardioides sp. JQ2195 TaxID=2592334 RepID=UPI00143ED4A9|nr:hypothetical protein [Nocardioides sp. JQ2195]QIX25909.1 hypothetical protein ncot_04315 [Nocardioides sp. JQ2195]
MTATRRRVLRGLVSLVVACGLGAGSAVLATQVLHDRRADAVSARAAALAPEARVDRVRHALDGLRDDGVNVAPDARDLLDPAGERKVARAIAASTTPVKVVVWTETSFAGASRFDLVQQLEAGLAEGGGHGVYLVWEGPEKGTLDTYGRNGYISSISTHEDFAGDPAITIPRLVRQVDEQVEWTDTNEDFDYYGGVGGGIGIGALYAVGVLLGVGLVHGLIVLVTKRRLPGGWRW